MGNCLRRECQQPQLKAADRDMRIGDKSRSDAERTRKQKGHREGAHFDWYFGSPTRARTWDLRINSPSLYQLSYQGISRKL